MKQLLPIALSLLMLPTAHAEPIPPVETFVLENGLTVLLREDHSVPLVAIQFRSRAGAILDPAGKEGVASLTADLLNYGTATRSEDQISDETARLGAVLSAGAGTESFVISGNVPTIADGALQRFIALFADVALHPSFPEEAFERAKALRIGALRGLVDDRAALASRAFSGFVFADHPYGRSVGGTLPSVTSITRSDLAAFHAQMVLPEETLIGVAGDFDAAEMKTALTGLFAHSWGSSRCVRAQSEGLCTAYRLADGNEIANPFATIKPVPTIDGIRILLVDTEDPTLNQAQIRLGLPIQTRYSDEGWHAYHLASQVLGGDFTARLNGRLRIREGLTYGARYASQYDDILPGAGYLSTYTSPRDVVKAIRMTREELARLREEPVPMAELQRVQQRLIRGFVFRFETAQDTLSEHMNLWQEKLPATHLETLNERIAALTPADLTPALDAFPDENFVIVVVGNAALIPDLQTYAQETGGTLEIIKVDALGLK